MKQILITLLLITNLLAQDNALLTVIKHPPIKHVFQGRNTQFCGTACALMTLQRLTAINLNDNNLLSNFAGMYNESSANGKYGFSPTLLLHMLGYGHKRLLYDTKGVTVENSKSFSLEKLTNDVIPELEKGNFVIIFISTGKGNVHAILLTSYDNETKKFTVNDPGKQRTTELPLDQVANLWPIHSNSGVNLYGFCFTSPPSKTNILLDPPVKLEVNVNADSLAKIVLPGGIAIPKSNAEFNDKKFYQAIEDAKLASISYYWEPARKADDVKGIPLWLKVKVAQGDPACLFFSKPDGSKKIVAVTGYRGGYKNFEGEMQITEIGDDGKLVKSWMKSAEVLQKGKSPRECGGDSFYIIYPKKPLVDPIVTENKDDSK